MIRHSIIIPTYNHLEDCLKPCLDSILKYTDFNYKEIIIIANGCTDGTLEFIKENYDIKDVPINVRVYEDPLGFPKAINEGVKVAKGKYITLFNNDNILLEQEKDRWIDMLESPLQSGYKISGCLELECESTGDKFIPFFNVMMEKSHFNFLDGLDERFSTGYGEDMLFCIKNNINGWEHYAYADGDFPIYHNPDQTVKHIPNWNKIMEKNLKLVEELKTEYLYNKKRSSSLDTFVNNVTAVICTKNRFEKTLLLAISAIATQTLPVKKLLIYEDGDFKNPNDNPVFKTIGNMLLAKNIDWSYLKGKGKGQVHSHQRSLEEADTDWIWRVDDDNIPESNVLESLCSTVYTQSTKEKKVAAVGSLILDPNNNHIKDHPLASSDIEDIYLGINQQFFRNRLHGVYIEVDHLHNSFLINRKISLECGGYNCNLSPACHREETMVTYDLVYNGYNVIIDTDCITWHLKANTGGIRDYTPDMFQHDEDIFTNYLKVQRKVLNVRPYKFFVLDDGIGDHFVFSKLLPEIYDKYSDYKIVLACCYKQIFENEDRIDHIISISDAKFMFGDIENFSVYKLGDMNKNKSLTVENLYRQIYDLERV